MWVILLALSGESVLFLRKYPSLRIYNDSMNKLRNWKKIHFFKNIVFNKKYSVCRLTNSNNCQFLYYIIGLSIVRQILLTNTFYKIKSIHLFFAFVLMFPLYFLLFCLLVVFYFFFLSLGFQQHVLTMPTSTLWVRPGENATLYCPLLDTLHRNKSSPTASTISWYRTAAGQGPQMLLTVMPSNTPNVTYGAGVCPGKVSVGVNGSLLLRGFQQNDSAVYFCGMSQGSKPEKKPDAPSHSGH